ncbi:MAG: hypothetical protein M0R33_17125 [Methylomonas sp.]|jgi:hypothetical protein|uniref:hypothetical protein n=1 Tax=Methylomonas sp. TaxID=418 RepID=UPI0026002FCE|nr:hypothetical protein [Methylomonas sp.]MCK9608169.1 hypothetical protein [Methylomonas sp.]
MSTTATYNQTIEKLASGSSALRELPRCGRAFGELPRCGRAFGELGGASTPSVELGGASTPSVELGGASTPSVELAKRELVRIVNCNRIVGILLAQMSGEHEATNSQQSLGTARVVKFISVARLVHHLMECVKIAGISAIRWIPEQDLISLDVAAGSIVAGEEKVYPNFTVLAARIDDCHHSGLKYIITGGIESLQIRPIEALELEIDENATDEQNVQSLAMLYNAGRQYSEACESGGILFRGDKNFILMNSRTIGSCWKKFTQHCHPYNACQSVFF